MRWLLLVLLLFGCAKAGNRGAQVMPHPMRTQDQETQYVVNVNRPVAQLISMLHFRLFDHKTFPDHEWVLCLHGKVRGDTVLVDYATPANIVQIDVENSRIYWNHCDERDWIGIWHNHPPTEEWGEACWLSTTDIDWQDSIELPLSLVSCGKIELKLVARVRDYKKERENALILRAARAMLKYEKEPPGKRGSLYDGEIAEKLIQRVATDWLHDIRLSQRVMDKARELRPGLPQQNHNL